MGVSFTLLEKQPLVLSLEVDKRIMLEMSFGFGGPKEAHVSTAITLSLKDLDGVIKHLQSIREELSKAKMCTECKRIMPPDSDWCDMCDSMDLESYAASNAAVV